MELIRKTSDVIQKQDRPLLTYQDIPYPAALIFNAGVAKFNGKYVMALPLAHPRQIGALGAHSEKWFNMHREWEEFLKN